jgi:hypothetical protein
MMARSSSNIRGNLTGTSSSSAAAAAPQEEEDDTQPNVREIIETIEINELEK